MRITKVHLAALAFVAGVLPSVASADGWFSRMGDPKEVTLTDLLRNPREYIDIEVKFKVYFDAPGENYNPYFTRFAEETYGNFTAWPIDARLYDKRDFPRPYPFFFASKMDKTWKKMKEIDHLRVIELTGIVREVFKGQPWIEVVDWSGSSGGLSDDDIRDVVRADAAFVAGRYKKAADLYEDVYSSRLADSVRADLQRRIGDAYFRAGEYGDAESAYERGLRVAPDNAVLKQGAEASGAARRRAKAARRGEAVEGSEPVIAPVEQPVVASNGTDEVIRLLEDPAEVEAEVAAWRLELERRAAALNGGTPVATPVAGSETSKPAAEEAPAEPTPAETAAAATEPVVEEEPLVAEGCGEATPAEGCGEPASEGSAAETESAEQPAGTHIRGPMETGEGLPAETAEQPAETVTEVPAETTTEQPAETTTEQPVETTEQPAESAAEQPAETDATGTAGGCAEAASEEASEGCAETSTGEWGTGEEACGEPEGAETVFAEEPVAVAEDRVMWVSGQMVRLPRLPFFGCEDVTDDDLRAIIQDVVDNPESDE